MDSPLRMEIHPPLHPVLGVAFINFIFVLILFIVFASFFAAPAGVEVRMPVAGAVEGGGSGVTVLITSENVLYFNSKVTTINDLKRELARLNKAGAVIYLNIDRKASMGRVSDVWELCNGLGAAKVKIITR